MGLDAADLDNDGWPDIYVDDMLPDDEYRFKVMTSYDSWDSYQRNVDRGFAHQFTRNTLQHKSSVGVSTPSSAPNCKA